MARLHRLLLTTDSFATAPPPEAVAKVSDSVVILAALLCALICVVGLVGVACCAWLRRVPGDAARSTAANRGLKKRVLRSFPKFAYSSGAGAGVKFRSSECPICLGEFVEGEEMRVLPQCGHAFHVSCIDTWMRAHSSCPSCRQVPMVARCSKCGRFPAVPGDGGGSAVNVGGEPNHCGDDDLLASK